MTDLREQLAAIVYDPTNGTAATDKALATAQDLIDSGLVPQWKPIETAPKDGTVIDLWCIRTHDLGEKTSVRKCDVSWGSMSDWTGGVHQGWRGISELYATNEATHWMPLPAAPGVQGGEA